MEFVLKWMVSGLGMFTMGIISFISNRKHLLSSLLSLEFMVLTLFYMMIMYLDYFYFEIYFSMVFLTFSVCEGALGVGVLVSLIRTHGGDYFSSFSILQC